MVYLIISVAIIVYVFLIVLAISLCKVSSISDDLSENILSEKKQNLDLFY